MSGLTTALADIWRLTWPYFNVREKGTVRVGRFTLTMQERFVAITLIGVIIVMNIAQVQISVIISYFSRNWFDAIQNKDAATFWSLLFFTWVPWVVVLIISYVIEFILTQALKMRWRSWMTTDLMDRWLDHDTHYRLQFVGKGVDNPDQRIQEDANKFITYTLSLSVGLINQISTLISFAVILWGLSVNLTIPGTGIHVPGLLVWIALAYASAGTLFAHLIGRKLIPLNFQQEHYEANFRFSLARLREYAESVALLKGEGAEKQHLGSRFRQIVVNFYSIVNVQKYLMAFQQFYGSSASVVPFVVIAPFYFTGAVTLGVMQQTAGAFSRVEGAIAFFIGAYTTVAEYKAVVDRLTGFRAAIGRARVLGAEPPRIEAATGVAGGALAIDDLSVALPGGEPIVAAHDIAFQPGAATLVTGPSGSGKSTLFRAIAGIWPFGKGRIAIPQGAKVMLLPQRPYLPIGPLRAAATYPAVAGAFDDEAVRSALRAVRLPHLTDQLDESRAWSQTLSLGEQQRLAVARALLARPDWLFLDEATAALDEPTEAAIYQVLKEALPQTTLVSIGHRSTLAAFHDRKVEMVPAEGGGFAPREGRLEPAPA